MLTLVTLVVLEQLECTECGTASDYLVAEAGLIWLVIGVNLVVGVLRLS